VGWGWWGAALLTVGSTICRQAVWGKRYLLQQADILNRGLRRFKTKTALPTSITSTSAVSDTPLTRVLALFLPLPLLLLLLLLRNRLTS
jgi:hypothetical protein